MKIGIDIDDTISNTYDVIFNYAQKYTLEELKRDLNISNNKSYYDHNYTESIHGWNKLESVMFWEKYYKEMLHKVRPKTFAKEYLDRLAEDYEIYLITARFDMPGLDVKGITEEWLSNYEIPYVKLLINANNKAKIAKENEIELFIDDSFNNCRAVSDIGIKTYLMDSRPNSNIDLSEENFERVFSWPHLYQKIKLKG